MTKPTTIKTEMYLVATLQDFGRPYVSLFIDKESNSLYLFVRRLGTKGNSLEYLIAQVTSDDIREYLNGGVGLGTLFSRKSPTDAVISGGEIIIGSSPSKDSFNEIQKQGLFEPEFCYDKLKIKTFLKRYSRGDYQPA